MPRDAKGRDFYIATSEEIKAGKTTDVYFLRTLDILKKAGKERTSVVAEVTAGNLPSGWPWGVLCGVEEAVHLLQGKSVSLWSLPEGSLFPPRTARGIPVPVMMLEGPYGEWALYETPILGMLCQASGIATKAARIRKLAGDKQVLSFGVRRMHPGIAPLIERSVYVAGVDAITTPLGAELFGAPAMGTMPHALVIVMGGPREAFAAVHKYLEAKIPRIALVDTYYDEKTEALLAVEAIPDLTGVRLDTPASRRGNFPSIVREVRWELDLRGHQDVQIFVSGSVDEGSIPALAEAGADGFGVGTSLSNAPTIDFAMDIVAVEGKPAAKRGKFGGRKDLQRCPKDGTYEVGARTCAVCGSKTAPAYVQYLDNGRASTPLPSLADIRRRTAEEISRAAARLDRPERRGHRRLPEAPLDREEGDVLISGLPLDRVGRRRCDGPPFSRCDLRCCVEHRGPPSPAVARGPPPGRDRDATRPPSGRQGIPQRVVRGRSLPGRRPRGTTEEAGRRDSMAAPGRDDRPAAVSSLQGRRTGAINYRIRA